MIVGKGDIASVLPDRKDLMFFASGVSNSQETNPEAFKRERELLMKQDKFSHLVYFSTLSIYAKESPYTKHKQLMEHLVKSFFQTYTIIRIGNITWGSNPNTFINNYKKCMGDGTPFHVDDVYRYIVDEEEFLYWINLIPNWSTEMNVPGRRMKVREILKKYGNA
jgi:hypothetical protein